MYDKISILITDNNTENLMTDRDYQYSRPLAEGAGLPEAIDILNAGQRLLQYRIKI